jgi:enamine deaminase RidA (YjgF/YER057c/UK114 family)
MNSNQLTIIENKGLVLPKSNLALASYISAKKVGRQIWVSGQLPFRDGELLATGKIDDSMIGAASGAIAQSFVNGLGAALGVLQGEKIKGVDKMSGFVTGVAGFDKHHLVVNGASDLAVELFGEEGRHVRAAVGVDSLPLNASVELEIVFSLW